jgi:hypothetical protein
MWCRSGQVSGTGGDGPRGDGTREGGTRGGGTKEDGARGDRTRGDEALEDGMPEDERAEDDRPDAERAEDERAGDEVAGSCPAAIGSCERGSGSGSGKLWTRRASLIRSTYRCRIMITSVSGGFGLAAIWCASVGGAHMGTRI